MTTQAQQIQDMEEQLNWHWRNSMKTVRFFSFDARAAWPLPILLLYPRLITLVISAVNLFIFRVLEQKGLTFPAAIRVVRSGIVSFFFEDIRYGQSSVYYRRFKDFG